MSQITEIAPDLYKICTYIKEVNLQFSQYLVLDDEPLLFHTGMRALFPIVRDAVATLMPVQKLRWISFSHFEADECGSLAEFQRLAPEATAVCSFVGKVVSVDDSAAIRLARALNQDEVLITGKYKFRYLSTPHVPHGWDAGVLFEDTHRTLLCSDLFHQNGDVESQTDSDVVGRFKQMLTEYEKSPFSDYLPYTSRTAGILERLARLNPKTLATMHGSVFVGDGSQALRDLNIAWKEVMSSL